MSQLNERVLNIWEDNKADKEKYIDQVWHIIERSYESIGGPHCNKEELMDDNIYWKIVRRGDRISAVCIYKLTPYGRKLFLLGSDGSDEGKYDLKTELMEKDVKFADRHFYAEVSGKPEYTYLRRGAQKLAAQVAQQLLGPNKAITPVEGDEYHYTRPIGPQKDIHTKIMIGNPKIEESTLTEEKSVSFDGEIAPAFGWCTIVIGGPGSGKTSTRGYGSWIQSKVHLPAKVYDTDALKWMFDRHKDSVNNTIKLPKINGDGFETVDLDKATVVWPPHDENGRLVPVGEPYSMDNPKYVSFMHDRLHGLSKKYQKQIQRMGKDADPDRLPNILFDISGDDVKKIEDIVFTAKEIGYKVALIWVYADLETALARNASRSRKGDVSLIIEKHAEIKNTVRYFIQNSKVFDEFDEFWIIITDEDLEADSFGRISNVYHIDSIESLKDVVDKHHLLESLKSYITENKIELSAEDSVLLKFEEYGNKLIESLYKSKFE